MFFLSHGPGILLAPWESWSLTRDPQLSLSLGWLKAFLGDTVPQSAFAILFPGMLKFKPRVDAWDFQSFLLPETHVHAGNTHTPTCLHRCSEETAITGPARNNVPSCSHGRTLSCHTQSPPASPRHGTEPMEVSKCSGNPSVYFGIFLCVMFFKKLGQRLYCLWEDGVNKSISPYSS